MNNQSKALTYASFVILCWSSVATAFKIALSELSYTSLLLTASCTATVVYLTALLSEKKLDLLKACFLNKKLLLRTVSLGLVNPLLYYLLLFKAYSLLPAQIAQPLNCSWQILLPIFACLFLKRKILAYQYIGLSISFIGIIFISLQGDIGSWKTGSLSGIILALCSAFVWAFYWVLKIDSKLDASVELFLNFLTASILLSVYFFFNGTEAISIKGLYAGIYVGLFEMGIAFLFWSKALKLTDNVALLSQLTYLSPFFSLILIHFILKEEIYWTTVTGLLLIIGGIIFNNRKTGIKLKS